MQKIKTEICALIQKLENNAFEKDTASVSVHSQLQALRHHMERDAEGSPNQQMQMDAAYIRLRQFWLDAVPWCSELSRDVEKIIIMYADRAENALKTTDRHSVGKKRAIS